MDGVFVMIRVTANTILAPVPLAVNKSNDCFIGKANHVSSPSPTTHVEGHTRKS